MKKFNAGVKFLVRAPTFFMPALDRAMQAPKLFHARTKLLMPALDKAMQAPDFLRTRQTFHASIRRSNAGTKLFMHAPNFSCRH